MKYSGKDICQKEEGFTNLIMDFRDLLEEGVFLSELYDQILERTGYWEELAAENTEEAEARMENLTELKNKIVKYEEEAEHPTLSELLEEIALVADVDNVVETEEKVLLMTLHSAKGLEFPCVFMGGMEDRLFPSGSKCPNISSNVQVYKRNTGRSASNQWRGFLCNAETE